MKRVAKLMICLCATITLTACATHLKSYTSPESLQEAYEDAGAECGEPEDVPEEFISEGAHALLCQDATMLLVFENEDQVNRYIARVGESDFTIVSNDRWVAIGDDIEDYAKELGGEVIER